MCPAHLMSITRMKMRISVIAIMAKPSHHACTNFNLGGKGKDNFILRQLFKEKFMYFRHDERVKRHLSYPNR